MRRARALNVPGIEKKYVNTYYTKRNKYFKRNKRVLYRYSLVHKWD